MEKSKYPQTNEEEKIKFLDKPGDIYLIRMLNIVEFVAIAKAIAETFLLSLCLLHDRQTGTHIT